MTDVERAPGSIFSMLHRAFGDASMEAVFSEAATVEAWLRTEASLARAQASVGELDPARAEAIAGACSLENIDLAFICMNLPFTMDVEQAASAVKEFQPSHVYPYHYRGRDDGTQDPEEFAKLVGDAVEVKMGEWYPKPS